MQPHQHFFQSDRSTLQRAYLRSLDSRNHGVSIFYRRRRSDHLTEHKLTISFTFRHKDYLFQKQLVPLDSLRFDFSKVSLTLLRKFFKFFLSLFRLKSWCWFSLSGNREKVACMKQVVFRNSLRWALDKNLQAVVDYLKQTYEYVIQNCSWAIPVVRSLRWLRFSNRG